MTVMTAGNVKNELEQFQTRERLLQHLRAEKQSIITAIEKFYSQNARPQAGAVQTLEEIINAFDRVITAGDWNSSLFLRNTVKPLQNMRDEAEQLRDHLMGNSKKETAAAPVLANGMIKVYIAIFQNKAQNLQNWEQQLKSLSQYILGRPIYRDENAVKQAIRAKLVQTSDAYVCVGVAESAVQTGEFHPSRIDKQGNGLLQLAPGSVSAQNILEFVYQDKHYHFIDGKLIEKNRTGD